MRPTPNHVHAARIIEWHDGDTVKLDTDQDYEEHNFSWHRLAGIDCDELPSVVAKAAKARVNELAPPGTPVITVSYKNLRTKVATSGAKEKYGRWLVELWTTTSHISINQTLLDEGLTRPYDGGKR